jgi:hypothetical protein
LQSCGFAFCGLGHQGNLQIWDLGLVITYTDLRFADWHNSAICRLAIAESPRICGFAIFGFAICGLTTKICVPSHGLGCETGPSTIIVIVNYWPNRNSGSSTPPPTPPHSCEGSYSTNCIHYWRSARKSI